MAKLCITIPAETIIIESNDILESIDTAYKEAGARRKQTLHNLEIDYAQNEKTEQQFPYVCAFDTKTKVVWGASETLKDAMLEAMYWQKTMKNRELSFSDFGLGFEEGKQFGLLRCTERVCEMIGSNGGDTNGLEFNLEKQYIHTETKYSYGYYVDPTDVEEV